MSSELTTSSNCSTTLLVHPLGTLESFTVDLPYKVVTFTCVPNSFINKAFNDQISLMERRINILKTTRDALLFENQTFSIDFDANDLTITGSNEAMQRLIKQKPFVREELKGDSDEVSKQNDPASSVVMTSSESKIDIPPKSECLNTDATPQHKISDLISEFNKILTTDGDLRVAYWQYDIMSRRDGSFEEFRDFCKIDRSEDTPMLVFGGF